jgi:hypothetical protein
MMKSLELGHGEGLGLYNVPKNSQDFFACVDTCCMCKSDHSFLLHPKSKCPFFPHQSHMNLMKNGKVKFFQTLKNRMTVHNYTNCTIKTVGSFQLHNYFYKRIQVAVAYYMNKL